MGTGERSFCLQNRTNVHGEGQRQHRDFEGEGKSFEVARPKSKSPGVISPGL